MLLNFALLAGLLAQAPVAPVKTTAPAKPAVVAAPERAPGLYVTFDVVQGAEPLGKIVCKFYEQESPITVKNFSDLARGLKTFTDPKTGRPVKRPFYNGLIFHRVIPGFMIQGGDPMGTGMGGTETIKDEYDLDLRFDRPGRLAMANAGPNTGSSQFFITEGTPSHLNGRHTIFGQVVEGQEIVDLIARVPRNEDDRPRTPVVMRRVTIEQFPRPVAPAKKRPAAKKTTTGVKPSSGVKPSAAKPVQKKASPAAKPKPAAAPAKK